VWKLWITPPSALWRSGGIASIHTTQRRGVFCSLSLRMTVQRPICAVYPCCLRLARPLLLIVAGRER